MVGIDESTSDFNFSIGVNFIIIFRCFIFLKREISVSRWVGDVTGTPSMECSVAPRRQFFSSRKVVSRGTGEHVVHVQ